MELLVWDTNMLVSGLILTVTFVFIFTEATHGIHRVKAAMLGAGAMMMAGYSLDFYSSEQAVEAIDWNVVFLLGCMMTIIAIMIPTGGFQQLAYKIAELSKGRLFLLLAMLGSVVTFLSLLLDNVTTVVIFGPLIILICQSLQVNPIPYLLAAALLSDTGGVATLVGDPPNLMIGSAANIGFNTFFYHMGPIVLAAWVTILVFLRFLFRKELSVTPEILQISEDSQLTDKRTWYAALTVLGLMVVGFILHDRLGWEPWFVAAIGLTLLIFLGHEIDLEKSFVQVELTLLMFFISLFMIVGGVEHSHFLEYLGQFIIPLVDSYGLLVTSIALMWISAVLSAAIDNIPFTAAMIPIILSMEAQGINVTPLWWSLAIGVGMGGNGTHLGSTANVFIVTISEKLAREQNDPSLAITPGLWFRKGTPVMILTLIVCSLIMAAFFDFFATPY